MMKMIGAAKYAKKKLSTRAAAVIEAYPTGANPVQNWAIRIKILKALSDG